LENDAIRGANAWRINLLEFGGYTSVVGVEGILAYSSPRPRERDMGSVITNSTPYSQLIK